MGNKRFKKQHVKKIILNFFIDAVAALIDASFVLVITNVRFTHRNVVPAQLRQG